jgi:cytochrome d ubiquinol oxidase subunit II
MLWPFLLIIALFFLGASWFFTKLYDNYLANPILFFDILLTVAALFATRFFIKKNHFFKAWFSSAIVILGSVFFGIIGLYPNMLPSNINTDFSVTAYNAASSPLTLKIMLVVVIMFIPAVIAYQAWAYYIFRGKVTKEDLSYEESY